MRAWIAVQPQKLEVLKHAYQVGQRCCAHFSHSIGTMELHTQQIEAAIEPLSHDNFDIAITLTGADRCALSKSVCVTGLGLAD